MTAKYGLEEAGPPVSEVIGKALRLTSHIFHSLLASIILEGKSRPQSQNTNPMEQQ